MGPFTILDMSSGPRLKMNGMHFGIIKDREWYIFIKPPEKDQGNKEIQSKEQEYLGLSESPSGV